MVSPRFSAFGSMGWLYQHRSLLFTVFVAVLFYFPSILQADEFELSRGLKLASISSELRGNASGDRHQPPPVVCFARCVSNCALENPSVDSLAGCESKCQPYGQETLCRDKEHRVIPNCWPRCKDLGLPLLEDVEQFKQEMTSPKNFSASYTEEFKINAKWDPIRAAVVFFVEIESDGISEDLHMATRRNSFKNLTLLPNNYICGPIELKISAANRAFITSPTRFVLERPRPSILAKMTLKSMTLEKTPFIFDEYQSDSTIRVELKYDLKKWPFGASDLDINPIFHMISCEYPDLENAIPDPEFKPDNESGVIVAKMSGTLMEQRCSFFYAVGETCNSVYQIPASNSDYSTLTINCETVKNSGCVKKEPPSPPICGQIKNFQYDVLNITESTENLEASNVSVLVKFEPASRKTPLYYVALYGHATQFKEKEKGILLGVNMTDVIGNATNCEQFQANGSCANISSENSLILDGLKLNTLYGVTLCAIFDPNDLTLPQFGVNGQQQRFLANELFLSSTTPQEQSPPDSRWAPSNLSIMATVLTIFVMTFAVVAILFWLRAQKNAKRKKRIEFEALRRQRPNEDRYVDMPKRKDSWELERQNLIVYDDKKLGAGAFGAVFLGKLVGLPRTRNGMLNLNLIRLNSMEKSLVAVKMLPEYADEVSKLEFLREISLMKKLGYHERLVNMLACITHSEPYCLVVEMCSDGDLLHFLRERCRYMLELNEAKVNYADPECEEEFNRDMIMSLKNLLAFMVQISYGLEYLVQKGFVHRDVAARNVLVHDKRYAKIGDFGLCRFIYSDSSNYKGRGGRLPVKWMSPEAIRHYEFTSASDVWSFGVLMFEIITLGGTPYPGMQPDDILPFLESGGRIPQPDNCPDELYKTMTSCWHMDARKRPEFFAIRQQLARQLEDITEEYAYLKLDARKDYYNVSYKEQKEQENGEKPSVEPE